MKTKSKGSELCDAIIASGKDIKTPKFKGAEQLRDAVKFINNRDESLNDGKSIFTLIGEFKGLI